jgi:hypothetical protein
MNDEAKSQEDGGDALGLFLNAFAAQDIAEAIPSFDDTTPREVIRGEMKARAYEIAGIRRAGFIVAWLTNDDLVGETALAAPRAFDPATIIPERTPLHLVVQGLNTAPYLFVQSFDQVSGYIHRGNLLKPAVRMWLFGLVTITELRVTRLIGEILPNDSWRDHLSPGRLQMAAELQKQRCQRNQHYGLLDCLQFADKARIVSRHDALRNLTRFASKSACEDFAKDFQSLRNSLAHSQDILSDWTIILDLATNLHRFVLGPEMPGETMPDVVVSVAGNNHETT